MTDVRIDATIFRPATFIETSIDNLTDALLLGTLLVILVLMAFLYEWRTALISVVAIPLSLVAAGLVLYHQGSTINTMVLAGFVISVGVVVDDAIIDVENIWRRLKLARATGDTTSTARIVLEASHRGPPGDRVRNADQRRGHHAGVLPGGTVRRVLPTARDVVRTGTPGVDGRCPHGDAGARPAPAAQAGPHPARVPAQGLPGPVVLRGPASGSRATARPAYFAVAGLALLAVAGTPQLGQSLLPEFKERDFLMHWITKPGTSLQEEVRITTLSAEGLGAIPGVRNFGAHIGQASNADEVVGPEFGENWISIDPAADYDETLQAVQTEVDGYPGLYRDVQTYLKERIREVLTGTDEAIVVRISGDDLDDTR